MNAMMAILRYNCSVPQFFQLRNRGYNTYLHRAVVKIKYIKFLEFIKMYY